MYMYIHIFSYVYTRLCVCMCHCRKACMYTPAMQPAKQTKYIRYGCQSVTHRVDRATCFLEYKHGGMYVRA